MTADSLTGTAWSHIALPIGGDVRGAVVDRSHRHDLAPGIPNDAHILLWFEMGHAEPRIEHVPAVTGPSTLVDTRLRDELPKLIDVGHRSRTPVLYPLSYGGGQIINVYRAIS